MSIYSGFATRHQQETYDQLVEDLIFVLQKRILKFYRHEDADQHKFLDVLKHIHSQMLKMQQHKYLEPKSSKSFQEVLKFLQAEQNNNPNEINYGQFMTPNKDSHTAPMRLDRKLKSHRDSFSQMNEPGSVGKIIHQIPRKNGDENTSLADSRNTFWNPQTKSKNQDLQKLKIQIKNPQVFEKEDCHTYSHEQTKNNKDFLNDSRSRNKNQTSLKGLKFHSNAKLPKDKQKNEDYLIEYLQKNSKHYLRGYRKRQIKTRQFSSKEHSSKV